MNCSRVVDYLTNEVHEVYQHGYVVFELCVQPMG